MKIIFIAFFLLIQITAALSQRADPSRCRLSFDANSECGKKNISWNSCIDPKEMSEICQLAPDSVVTQVSSVSNMLLRDGDCYRSVDMSGLQKSLAALTFNPASTNLNCPQQNCDQQIESILQEIESIRSQAPDSDSKVKIALTGHTSHIDNETLKAMVVNPSHRSLWAELKIDINTYDLSNTDQLESLRMNYLNSLSQARASKIQDLLKAKVTNQQTSSPVEFATVAGVGSQRPIYSERVFEGVNEDTRKEMNIKNQRVEIALSIEPSQRLERTGERENSSSYCTISRLHNKPIRRNELSEDSLQRRRQLADKHGFQFGLRMGHENVESLNLCEVQDFQTQQSFIFSDYLVVDQETNKSTLTRQIDFPDNSWAECDLNVEQVEGFPDQIQTLAYLNPDKKMNSLRITGAQSCDCVQDNQRRSCDYQTVLAKFNEALASPMGEKLKSSLKNGLNDFMNANGLVAPNCPSARSSMPSALSSAVEDVVGRLNSPVCLNQHGQQPEMPSACPETDDLNSRYNVKDLSRESDVTSGAESGGQALQQ